MQFGSTTTSFKDYTSWATYLDQKSCAHMHALVHATMRSDPRYEFEGKTHAIGGVHCVSEGLNKLELPMFRRDVVRGFSSRRNSVRSLYLN